MCIGNEQKPSKEERKTLTIAYRAFIQTEEGLLSPFEHSTDADNNEYNRVRFNFSKAQKDKNGFVKATNLKSYPDDAGFYAFKTIDSVKLFKTLQSEIYPSSNVLVIDGVADKIVVAKVEIKEIIGIGDAYRFMGIGIHGDDLNEKFPKHEIIRCKKMKILEVIE